MCALNLIYCFNNACRIFLRRHSTPNERIQLLLVAFILWCLNISIINKINCHLFYISSTTVFLTVQMLNQFHVKQQQKKLSFGALFNKNSEFYVNPMFMSKTSKKKIWFNFHTFFRYHSETSPKLSKQPLRCESE